MFVTTTFKPVTIETVNTAATALLASIRHHEQQIATAERAAELLAPIAHHKRITSATMKRLDASGEVRGYLASGVTADRHRVHVFLPESRVGIDVMVARDATVADLIAALRECQYERQQLVGCQTQFELIEELAEAEERIRQAAVEIERIRKDVTRRMTGRDYPGYLHEAVKNAFPALGKDRY